MKAADETAKNIIAGRKLYETEGIILDNQNKQRDIIKKEKEISILENQLKDYKLTRALAWISFFTGIVLLILKLIGR